MSEVVKVMEKKPLWVGNIQWSFILAVALALLSAFGVDTSGIVSEIPADWIAPLGATVMLALAAFAKAAKWLYFKWKKARKVQIESDGKTAHVLAEGDNGIND